MPYMICVNQPGHLPEAAPYAVENLYMARACMKDEIERTRQAFDGPDSEITPATEAVALGAVDMLGEDGGTVPIGRYVVEASPISFDEYERWLSEEDFE